MVSRRKRKARKKASKKEKPKKEERVETAQTPSETARKGFFAMIYEEHYKSLLVIPFLMLAGALGVIAWKLATTGTIIDQDVSLKGGLSITYLGGDVPGLEGYLRERFPKGDIVVRKVSELGRVKGIIIEASDVDSKAFIDALKEKIPGFEEQSSVESIGPSLGSSFFKQTMLAILAAFVLMSLVVFYYFRTFTPSMAVVLAAFSDITVTIGVMNLLGLKLSTAGIAALLMLIGYSVDTDILLSTRVLKEKEGSVMKRVLSAVKTGLTMNVTTLAAVTVALFMSQSETISQIMRILLIGLLADVINTWIQNVGILRIYLERKEAR